MALNEINVGAMLLNKEYRSKIYENYEHNGIIINYHKKLADNFKEKPRMYKNIIAKMERLKDCNKIWELDHYQNIHWKDFKKTYLCKNPFCYNCKKWKQAHRMKKFLKPLSEYDDDLYFVTFTVPNVRSADVKETIKKIFKAHRKLVDFMQNPNKCTVIDFSKFNFKGGIRVLEISLNRSRKEKYHVHIHCAYILKDYKPSKPYIVNAFSIDNTGRRDYVRKYTNEEVDLQKIWLYLYDDVNLKKDVIDKNNYKAMNPLSGRVKTYTNKGYSVTIDKFKPGEYQEMFKYMVKDKVKALDEQGNEVLDDLSYDEFFTLYFAIANVRQLETYGILKNIDDEDDLDFEDEVNEMYEGLINYLSSLDSSVPILEHIKDVAINDSFYFTKKKIYSYLRKVYMDELKEGKSLIEIDNKLNSKEYKDYEITIREMISHDKLISKKNESEYVVNNTLVYRKGILENL